MLFKNMINLYNIELQLIKFERHTLKLNNIMDNSHNSGDISKCPFMGGNQKESAGSGTSNRDWWPNELKLNILRQNGTKSNPMGEDFDYTKAFNSINYQELKADIVALMTDSQDWWPADYGHYDSCG